MTSLSLLFESCASCLLLQPIAEGVCTLAGICPATWQDGTRAAPLMGAVTLCHEVAGSCQSPAAASACAADLAAPEAA